MIKRFRICYITCTIGSLSFAMQAGLMQDAFFATFDMRDHFFGTSTQVPANTGVHATILRANTDEQALLLVENTEAQRIELEHGILAMTGTALMVSTDPSVFTDKSAIDSATLTLYELLKTILLKLNQMAP